MPITRATEHVLARVVEHSVEKSLADPFLTNKEVREKQLEVLTLLLYTVLFSLARNDHNKLQPSPARNTHPIDRKQPGNLALVQVKPV